MEAITITTISRKEKEGSKGKYISVGIKAEEYGDRWINGFENKTNELWQNGDRVEVIVYEKTIDDKTYLNFQTLRKEDKMNE